MKLHSLLRVLQKGTKAFCTTDTAVSMAELRAPALVTFDIDGTLLGASGKNGNSAHKRALEHAVQKIHGIRVQVNDVPYAGCTDRGIIRSMCLHGGVTEASANSKMDNVIAEADAVIPRLIADDGGSLHHLVLPGVYTLLHELSRRGTILALTTGNLQSCAWVKLKAAGIHQFFETGGFGSDCFHRSDILRTAIQRVTEQNLGVDLVKGVNGEYQHVFHVGDAVADMVAARDAGTKGIGVLTGAFSKEQLEAEKPYVVLEDLSDTKKVLEIMTIPA